MTGKIARHHKAMKNKLKAPMHTMLCSVDQFAQPCDCLLLLQSASNTEEPTQEDEAVVPMPAELQQQLSVRLASLFPSPGLYSILLLHVAQLKPTQLVADVAQKRQSYHMQGTALEQILTNVRRVIRSTDQIVTQPGVAAAFIFPQADYQGASGILERVYHSISLLQAETIVPPLQQVTVISLGIGTVTPETPLLDTLFSQVSRAARSIILRPTMPMQSWTPQPKTRQKSVIPPEELRIHTMKSRTVPFMHLPTQLPDRLKHLVPHHLACEWRCAPIGRNHQSLTVAMAEPTNTYTLNHLAEVTGMTIFPVSCENEALNLLLDQAW